MTGPQRLLLDALVAHAHLVRALEGSTLNVLHFRAMNGTPLERREYEDLHTAFRESKAALQAITQEGEVTTPQTAAGKALVKMLAVGSASVMLTDLEAAIAAIEAEARAEAVKEWLTVERIHDAVCNDDYRRLDPDSIHTPCYWPQGECRHVYQLLTGEIAK